jgi:ATP-dependent Zn protease
MPLEGDVDGAVLAHLTPGFSGASITRLVNEAALLAVKRQMPAIGMAEFTSVLGQRDQTDEN